MSKQETSLPKNEQHVIEETARSENWAQFQCETCGFEARVHFAGGTEIIENGDDNAEHICPNVITFPKGG